MEVAISLKHWTAQNLDYWCYEALNRWFGAS